MRQCSLSVRVYSLLVVLFFMSETDNRYFQMNEHTKKNYLTLLGIRRIFSLLSGTYQVPLV